jgi:hypothetical protein
LEAFRFETFEGRTGERFRVEFAEGATKTLELVEVTQLGAGAADRRDPFSLLFAGDPGEPYPQQIYPVEHDELGRFELFLVPLAPDQRGALYEAVFA